MQNLLLHLIQQHVSASPPPILSLLASRPTLTLSSSLALPPQDLPFLQYLLAKNILIYSPAHLALALNRKALLLYQRGHKIQHLATTKMTGAFGALLEKFLGNELLPVRVSEKEMRQLRQLRGEEEERGKGGDRSKGSKKKKEELAEQKGSVGIDYSLLFYEYSSGSSDKQDEVAVNLDELTEHLKYHYVERSLGKERAEDLRRSLSALSSGEGEPVNREGGKIQLLAELYGMSLEKSGARADLLKQTMTKLREERVEEYLMQLFRKHDPLEESTEEAVSRNCLLTFNLVRRNPLISEKEMSALSLLPMVQQRKCLNLLVQEGLVHFYPEGPRSLAYRIREYEQIEQMLVEGVARSILNLHLLMAEGLLKKEQLLKMECMLADLDDILLLFL